MPHLMSSQLTMCIPAFRVAVGHTARQLRPNCGLGLPTVYPDLVRFIRGPTCPALPLTEGRAPEAARHGGHVRRMAGRVFVRTPLT